MSERQTAVDEYSVFAHFDCVIHIRPSFLSSSVTSRLVS